MADRTDGSAKGSGKAILRIRDLQVYYGESHAIQGVNLTLETGILSIVGRNGMGKTTLCNTIVGLKRARSGSIALAGREISSLEPHAISRLGIGYVPQGRRVWRSLSVDEHLRLAQRGGRDAVWTVERVYEIFPRLAERRTNGGGQLSGGEQQMLAIGRALLGNPRLLVMDEPTEGLAPIIVDQVAAMLVGLGQEGDLAVIVIEQNIGGRDPGGRHRRHHGQRTGQQAHVVRGPRGRPRPAATPAGRRPPRRGSRGPCHGGRERSRAGPRRRGLPGGAGGITGGSRGDRTQATAP